RRRHSWLHAASTSALRLDNRHYVYQSRDGDDSLIVALNIDGAALEIVLGQLGVGHAQVIAGSGMPPEEVVDTVSVEPHGWRILRPV
ncbi:MAG TPA: alpha-amylase, partial [Mycobacterium sp.]